MDANLVRRLLVAAVAIPLAVLLVWQGGWPLAALMALIGALGCRELFDLAAKQGIAAFRTRGMIAAAIGPLLVYLAMTNGDGRLLVRGNWAYLVAAFMVMLLVQVLHDRSPAERPLGAVAVTLFGVAYTAMLPSFLLAIRHGAWLERSWAGTALVFFPLVVTWVGDSAAMLGGRAIGGAKLAPTISPGKTRSGAIAGLVGAAAVAPLFALWLLPMVGIRLGVWQSVAMALVLGVVGQLGDLAESLFKREAGVKDSSSLIPGHGGVLDRFDSLYVVLPIAALCYRLLGVV